MKKRYLLLIILIGLFICPNKVFAYDDYVDLFKITNGDSEIDLNNPYEVDGDTIVYYLNHSFDFSVTIKGYDFEDTDIYSIEYEYNDLYHYYSQMRAFYFTRANGWTFDFNEADDGPSYFYPFFSFYFVDDNALKIKVGDNYYNKVVLYFVDPDIFVRMDEFFNGIAPDGELDVNAVYTDDLYASYSTTVYGLEQYNTEDYFLTGMCYSEDDCVVNIYDLEADGLIKTYKVKYNYKEENADAINKINKYIDNFEDLQESIGKTVAGTDDVVLAHLEDLEAVNYLYTIRNWVPVDLIASNTAAVHFSKTVSDMLEHSNVDVKLYVVYQDRYPTYYESYGYMPFIYNGIAYSSIYPMGYDMVNVIYIPDETEDTRDAFINAATNRIKEYVGDEVEIVYEDQIANLTAIEQSKIDISKTIGEYYKVTFGTKEYSFFIVKDSSKMQVPEVSTVDFDTDAKVEVDSPKIPLDSQIVINELDKNSDEYKSLLEKLHVTEAEAFDVNLISASTSVYVGNLENGSFKVYIPLSDTITSQDLKAYFVKDDGSIEEHEVTVENGFAVFETDHFSVYTLAHKDEEESGNESGSIEENTNPPTNDNIMTYVGIGAISLAALVVIVIVTIRSKKTKDKQ